MKNLKVTTGILTIAFVALSSKCQCKVLNKASNEGDSPPYWKWVPEGDHSEMKQANNGDGHQWLVDKKKLGSMKRKQDW